MRKANCEDCGGDHTSDYKIAEAALARRHRMFSVMFLFCVSVAIVAGWFVAPGFGVWTAAIFGIYFAYVNLASLDQGRALVSRAMADATPPPKSADDDENHPGGGNYL